jgi:Fe-S-cluster containining protein
VTSNDPQSAYLGLVERLDDFVRRVTRRYPTMLACGPGCDDCCQRNLSLFPIESARLVESASCLPPPARAGLLARARKAASDPEAPCPFLDGKLCLAYQVRPVLCRTHGLPMLIPGESELSICPLNFKEVLRIEGDCVLDLGPVNQVLATANLLWARELKRSPDRVALSRAVIDGLSGDKS